MKRYFGYVRVSTPRQGEGVSPDEQRRLISQYALKHQIEIIAWFEEHRTAAKRGRQIFDRMLCELGEGRAEGVIVHKLDRSIRNLPDWARLNDLFDCGVDVRFVHEGLDLNSRAGRLTADILAVVASDFIRNNRDETLKGFYGRLNQGLYPLPAPIGYLDNGKGQPKTPDPKTAPLVREMFDRYASGRYTLATLRAEMTRLGFGSRRGRALSRNAYSRILSDPFYIGVIKIRRRGETFPGIHQPLVAKRIFDRVQSILSGRYHVKVRKHDLPFRRLIRCVRCGRCLYGEPQKGHVYYRCQSPGCRGTSFRQDVIEARLAEPYALIRLDDEEMRDLRDIAREDQGDEVRAEAERVDRLRATLNLLNERLTRLTDLLVDGTLDKEVFDVRKERLLIERRELLDAIERPEYRFQSDALLENLERGNSAYLQLRSLDPAEIREVVEQTISNLGADGKELGITLRFPFDRIAAKRISRSGAPHGAASRTGSDNCDPSIRGANQLETPGRFTREELRELLKEMRAATCWLRDLQEVEPCGAPTRWPS